MANLKLFLLSIFLIFAIMTCSITAEETEKKTEVNNAAGENADAQSEAGEEVEVGEGEEEGEGDFNPEEAQGNVLDEEEGKNAMKELGFDTKESLTKAEMIALYEKVFLKKEYSEAEEKKFYEDLVNSASKDVPDKVLNSEVRNYFDIQYLMKYIQQDQQPMDGSEEPKQDM